MKARMALCWCASILLLPAVGAAQGQGHPPTPLPRQGQTETEDPAAVERGQALFKSTCGFCHGEDATGSRAPDLVRSSVTLRDDHGNLLSPVIRNGRPDKGMPSFATLKDDQVADIIAFLHHQANAALHSGSVPGDYPAAKLLTGNAQAGKAFFYGAGDCSHCHSVTGDLAGIAKRLSPVNLQQEMVYPAGRQVRETAYPTATVTLPNGTRYEGKVSLNDEFNIGIICQDGWYRSWPKADVKTEIHDPLAAHRELTGKYTDADLHNLFAFLETLK